MENIIQMYSPFPSGEKRENRYFYLFASFITVPLMQQHIKKYKEEKKSYEACECYKKDMAKQNW